MRLDGVDVAAMDERSLRRYRGGVVSMVFQEPGMAFDPVCTIGDQIVESIRAHEPVDRATARARALSMLDRVGIPQAARRLRAYPHELSGGMRQRAMIALALACRPRLLLADEPTTALDATVQIQILLLLRELQRETGMAVIFVTHDIGAAVEVADRIAVMYAGRIVEDDRVDAIVSRPRHRYSAGLLASTVATSDRGRPLATIRGAPPDLSAVPPGCAFAPRCDGATARCATTGRRWSTTRADDWRAGTRSSPRTARRRCARSRSRPPTPGERFGDASRPTRGGVEYPFARSTAAMSAFRTALDDGDRHGSHGRPPSTRTMR